MKVQGFKDFAKEYGASTEVPVPAGPKLRPINPYPNVSRLEARRQHLLRQVTDVIQQVSRAENPSQFDRQLLAVANAAYFSLGGR